MPSPIAHALAGFAGGWIVAPAPAADRGGNRSRTYRRVLLFGAAGAAADIDLLFHAHSGPTHGLASAVVAGSIVWCAITWAARRGSGNEWGASAVITAGAVAF